MTCYCSGIQKICVQIKLHEFEGTDTARREVVGRPFSHQKQDERISISSLYRQKTIQIRHALMIHQLKHFKQESIV